MTDTLSVNEQTATPRAEVAAKAPQSVIRQALAESKADGAVDPPKTVHHKMKLYAIRKLKRRLVEHGE